MRLKVRRSLICILAVILAATVIAFGAALLSQSSHTAYAASGTPVPVTQSDFLDVWDNGTNTKTLQMTENVNVSSTLTVASGKNITLDLNGYALTFTGETGSVIEVAGEFTLKDSWSFVSTDDVAHMHNILNPATDDTVLVFGGVITGGKGKVSGSSTLGGAIFIANDGKMTMESGKISGNDISSKSDPHGGAIRNEGEFIMNGGEISYNKAVCGGGICVNDGNTEINGGAIMWNTATGDGGGVFYENTKPNVKFTFTDGEICYNTAADVGGGVHLYSGEMTMRGRAHIYQNISEKEGGGIHVDYDSRNSAAATLNMSSGTINFNTANGTGGGGVYVNNGGIFNMSNGVIYGNKGVEGGGVYLNSTFGSGDLAKFNVSGFPSIKDNISSDTGDDTPSNVHIIRGNISVTGTLSSYARIGVDIFNSPDSCTVATTANGGVIESVNSFIPDNEAYVCTYLKDGSVTVRKTHALNANHVCDKCGAVATVTAKTGDDTSYYATIGNAWAAANAAAQATEIKLLADVTTATTLEVASGKTITLDLNGHALTFTGDSGSVIKVSGTFTLEDSDATTSHEILSPVTDENVTVNGGLITGGTGADLSPNDSNLSGGAVCVVKGKFIFNGGTIAGNTATHGGGVNVKDGEMILDGGVISHNSAVLFGGGIYLGGNSSGDGTYSTLALKRGSISQNTVTTSSDNGGGGVCIDDNSLFVMEDGEICGNTVSTADYSLGGGVLVCHGKFTMTGGEISGNTASVGGGVCLSGIVLDDSAIMALSGGKVKNNTGSGGIAIMPQCALEVSGAPVVEQNKQSNGVIADALCHGVIRVAGALNKGARVGVYALTPEVPVILGYATHNAQSPNTFFVSNRASKYCFNLNGENLVLKEHDLVDVEEKAATCTEKGLSAHKQCSRCSAHTQYTETEALGHDWEDGFTVDRQPTCTEKGSQSKHCSRCEEKKDVTEIAFAAHTLTHVNKKDATVTATGNIEYWECSVCRTKFSDNDGSNKVTDIVIPMLKSELVKPDENGGENQVVVSTPNGFAHGVELVVTEISKNNYGAYESVAQTVNGEIGFVYDVTLKSGGVEIQPDGTLTIKLRIPDNLKDKTFKLFHLHGGEATDTAYTVDGNYAVVETDRLSEFIFVGEKAAEPVPDGGKGLSAGAVAGISVAAVMVALLAAYIACYFALFRRGVLLKGKVWDAIYKPMNAIFNKKTKE